MLTYHVFHMLSSRHNFHDVSGGILNKIWVFNKNHCHFSDVSSLWANVIIVVVVGLRDVTWSRSSLDPGWVVRVTFYLKAGPIQILSLWKCHGYVKTHKWQFHRFGSPKKFLICCRTARTCIFEPKTSSLTVETTSRTLLSWSGQDKVKKSNIAKM